jgi:hypothetical protein
MATLIEAIRGSITKDLSSSLKKSTEQFVKDLFLVTVGVRTAFLIDYASIEISKLRIFLQSLGKGFAHLAAIEIDDFVFVINKNTFAQQFETDRSANYARSIFVDIDKTRSAQAADEQLRNTVCTALTKHLHTIQSTLDKNLVKPTLNLDCGIFIITISGWLLEYCCVYFHGGLYRNNKGEDWNNNLSMVPLNLYTVYIESTDIDIAHASQSDGSKLMGVSGENDMVPVLAFSVPESVEEGLKDKFSVDQVLQERFSSRISDIPCLKSVSVSKQQIALPHVLL